MLRHICDANIKKVSIKCNVNHLDFRLTFYKFEDTNLRKMHKEHVDVLIIGAGPSGAVAAGILEKSGLNIKIIEKEKFPRFVIGESLIPRVMDHFDEAGFMDDLNAQGFEKKFGARFLRGNEVCWFDFSEQFTKGWSWTWQMPRAEFDHTLAQSLIKRGVPLEFETAVTDIQFEGTSSVTTVVDKEGNTKQIHAKFVIDSSGYGRVLPRLLDLDKPSTFEPMAATFTHVKDVRRPNNQDSTLITFDVLSQKVWFWVIPFSNGNTSLGLVCPKEYFESIVKENPTETFNAIIQKSDYYKERFGGLPFLFEPKQLVSYAKAVKKLYGPGFALTGNSAEFLDPVFSSGVCFATESGSLSAKLALRQIRGEEVNWQVEYEDHIMSGVNVFRSYIRDWYSGDLQKFFFHPEVNQDIRTKVCSVLAGYVWDKTNPFVKKHDYAVRAVTQMLP